MSPEYQVPGYIKITTAGSRRLCKVQFKINHYFRIEEPFFITSPLILEYSKKLLNLII